MRSMNFEAWLRLRRAVIAVVPLALAMLLAVGCGAPLRARVAGWSFQAGRCHATIVIVNESSRPVRAQLEITASALAPVSTVPSRGARTLQLLARERTMVDVPARGEIRVTRALQLRGLRRPSFVRVRVL